MSRLIICQTPLHFLMAYLVNLQNPAKCKYIFIAESEVNESFINEIISLTAGEFIKLPGAGGLSTFWRRTAVRKNNIKAIRRSRFLECCDQALVFHDSTPETQYVLAKMMGRGGRNSLGEDGVAIYDVGGTLKKKIMLSLVGKLVYGAWWRPQERIGTNENLHEIYATYPELISNTLRNRDVFAICKMNRSEVGVFCSGVSAAALDFTDRALCIIPLISSVMKSDLDNFLSNARMHSEKLGLKFHPRESYDTKLEFLHGHVRAGDVVVENSIPAEVLVFIENTPTAVFGFRSSALHLIKFLMPTAAVFYFEDAHLDDKWRTFYKQTNIQKLNKNGNH